MNSSHAFDCINEMVQEAPGMAVSLLLAALDVCDPSSRWRCSARVRSRTCSRRTASVVIGDFGARGAQARQGSLPPLLGRRARRYQTQAYGIAW